MFSHDTPGFYYPKGENIGTILRIFILFVTVSAVCFFVGIILVLNKLSFVSVRKYNSYCK